MWKTTVCGLVGGGTVIFTPELLYDLNKQDIMCSLDVLVGRFKKKKSKARAKLAVSLVAFVLKLS